jgi:hypothetical protein
MYSCRIGLGIYLHADMKLKEKHCRAPRLLVSNQDDTGPTTNC